MLAQRGLSLPVIRVFIVLLMRAVGIGKDV